VGTENHGGNKRLHRVRCALRVPRPAIIALSLYPLMTVLALVLGMPQAAAAIGILGAVNAGALVYQGVHLGRILYQVLEIVGERLNLAPVRASGSGPG
jgi:membrane associated rhomboid family serine protease